LAWREYMPGCNYTSARARLPVEAGRCLHPRRLEAAVGGGPAGVHEQHAAGHVADTPALFLDSWHDYGPADTFALAELWRKNATSERTRDNVFVVVAPTTHCVYAQDREQTIVGQRDLGDARFDFYGLYLRWFDRWLKGIDNGVTRMPKVQIFVMGKNQWRGEEEWPLRRTRFTKFYLRSDGRAQSRTGTGVLSIEPPRREPSDTFEYDPARPVASVGGPDFGTPLPGLIAGAVDQSEVEMRHDVLVYTTAPLEKGLEVTGPLEAVLFVSSSAPDTDFTAKLVDVFPDGRAFNVQEGILRARYRDGFDKKAFMREASIASRAASPSRATSSGPGTASASRSRAATSPASTGTSTPAGGTTTRPDGPWPGTRSTTPRGAPRT